MTAVKPEKVLVQFVSKLTGRKAEISHSKKRGRNGVEVGRNGTGQN